MDARNIIGVILVIIIFLCDKMDCHVRSYKTDYHVFWMGI